MIKRESFQQAKFSFRVFLIVQLAAIAAGTYAAFRYFSGQLEGSLPLVYQQYVIARFENMSGLLKFHRATVDASPELNLINQIANNERVFYLFYDVDHKVFVYTPIAIAILITVLFVILKNFSNRNAANNNQQTSRFGQ